MNLNKPSFCLHTAAAVGVKRDRGGKREEVVLSYIAFYLKRWTEIRRSNTLDVVMESDSDTITRLML